MLHGKSDISKAVQQMLVDFKVLFEEELTTLLASRLLQVAREALDAKLGIDGDGSPVISKKLLVEPVFNAHYVAFVFDGSYSDSSGGADDADNDTVIEAENKKRLTSSDAESALA